jgi:ABC-type dipeptide/oligopeptide/nickel transport system ATPase component
LLQVQDLTLRFHQTSHVAVNGVSFSLKLGEALGLLGESGAGKTTLARALLHLLPPHCQVLKGSIQFRGTEILRANESELQKIRGAQISFIGQEPELALNPVISIGEQIAEVIRAHSTPKRDFREEVLSMLTAVGLPEEHFYTAYPHQLSGGQRQRVVIAQALACKPQLLIADEPTSALDNVIQAEILALLKKLRDRLQLALVFITHNPALFSGLADRVAVMYAGRIVEEGTFDQIYWRPQHSYFVCRGCAGASATLTRSPPFAKILRSRRAAIFNKVSCCCIGGCPSEDRAQFHTGFGGQVWFRQIHAW